MVSLQQKIFAAFILLFSTPLSEGLLKCEIIKNGDPDKYSIPQHLIEATRRQNLTDHYQVNCKNIWFPSWIENFRCLNARVQQTIQAERDMRCLETLSRTTWTTITTGMGHVTWDTLFDTCIFAAKMKRTGLRANWSESQIATDSLSV